VSIRKRIVERLVSDGRAADAEQAGRMIDEYAGLTEEQRGRLASLADRLRDEDVDIKEEWL